MPSSNLLYKIGLKIAFITFIGGGWLILCTLPPLNQTGIWFQSESAEAVWLLLGGMSGLALGFMALQKPFRIRRSLVSPLVFLPLGMGGLASLSAFTTSFPGRALLGAPELGEGALTYLALGLFSAVILALRGIPQWRKIIVINGSLIAIIATALTIQGTPQWQPYHFPDFLAFVGVFAWLGVSFHFNKNKVAISFAVLALLLIVFASQNRAAWLAIIGGASLWVIYNFTTPKIRKFLPFFPPTLLLLTPVIMWVLLTFIPLQNLSLSVHDTLKSRLLMSKMVVSSLGTSPKAWLLGKGLGSYSHELAISLRDEKTTLHNMDDGKSGWFWDAGWRGDFHPHNQAMEMLLGGGLPTLALFLLYIFYIGRNSRYPALGLIFATMLAILFAFWFMPSTLFPLMAYAVCLQSRGNGLKQDSNLQTIAPILGWAGFTLFLAASVILKQAADSRAVLNQGFILPENCAPPFVDFRRGQDHLNQILYIKHSKLISSLRRLDKWERQSWDDADISPSGIEYLQKLLCIADKLPENPAPLVIRTILLRNDLAFTEGDKLPAESFPAYTTLRSYALDSWDKAYERLQKTAPRRTDLLAPYFLWQIKQGQEENVKAKTALILSSNPTDSVALWFSGMALLADPSRQKEAIERMREALRQGFEQIMPIDAQTKALLLSPTR